MSDMRPTLTTRSTLPNLPERIQVGGTHGFSVVHVKDYEELRSVAERIVRELAEAKRDAGRFSWCLPLLTSGEDAVADARAMRLANSLLRGLDGREAIDDAMDGAP